MSLLWEIWLSHPIILVKMRVYCLTITFFFLFPGDKDGKVYCLTWSLNYINGQILLRNIVPSCRVSEHRWGHGTSWNFFLIFLSVFRHYSKKKIIIQKIFKETTYFNRVTDDIYYSGVVYVTSNYFKCKIVWH